MRSTSHSPRKAAPVAPSGTVARLPPRARVERLLRVARGRKRGLIFTHDNPDPDSMAAAAALAHLLEVRAGVPTKVAYGGIIGRAENKAFVEVLKLPVVHVSELDPVQFDLRGVVDTQPCVGNHSLPEGLPVDVVIDHHPLRDASLSVPFADVGGDFGATSTMLVEYLRAARLEPSQEIATALFYGVKADTRDLGRETTQSDIDAYLWLFPRSDRQRLARIEHPDLPRKYFALYHGAFERAKVYGDAILTDLGEIYTPDMVAEVAERLMSLEGMRWSLAWGTYRSQLYFSLRTRDRRMNAGRLMRETCSGRGGSAGGHGSMAGARLPLWGTRAQRAAFRRDVVRGFLEAFGQADTEPVPLLDGA
jgi:nanoRNase/pAp phosphatase (c-di-AMP/oligoRNAs hydrolase)